MAELRSPEKIRVLVVDDHDVVHWGFRLMLMRHEWVERCVSAHGSEEALALAGRYRPHVAVVDLFIGAESGAEVCEVLRAADPNTRVLLMSGAGSISRHAALAAGASGFAYKDWSAAKIATAVHHVALGGTMFEYQAQSTMMGLSEREHEVLELIATGATNPEIGVSLHLSRHTVKEHTTSLYRKLGVHRRVEAVQAAQRLGLLE